MPAVDASTYGLQDIQQMLGLSRAVVIGYVKAGFVDPARGMRKAYRFGFRDVVLLRTAQSLRVAHVPARRIRRALDRLRTLLPSTLPLTGLRITAVGDDVAVWDGAQSIAAVSGQLLLDFEVSPATGTVVAFPHARDEPTNFDHWIARGEALEANDPDASVEAYEQAIALEPRRSDGYLDLGALLHARGALAAALQVYDRALAAIDDDPDVSFNRAIVLEDLGRGADALESYEICLRLDPDHADAHWNAARVYEQSGSDQQALRHFSAFRRLRRRST